MKNCIEYKGYIGSVEFSGSFNIRISPELHKKIAVYAMEHNITLNSLVEQSVEKQLATAY